MGNPHKHKDAIVAWANGAPIQFKNSFGEWKDCGAMQHWHLTTEYRVKPEPKPDEVSFDIVRMGNYSNIDSLKVAWGAMRPGDMFVKLTRSYNEDGTYVDKAEFVK